jgi:putative ABC transport system ATP-binding protein
MGPAARLVDAARWYDVGGERVVALAGVTLDVRAGVMTAVVGPSGSGKTTLLQAIAGLDRLSAGQVFVGDVELSALSGRRLVRARRERTAMIAQHLNLHQAMDIAANLALPGVIQGRKPDGAWADRVISRLGLEPLLRRYPAELSGGEQQRVAVGRALFLRPDLLLADEPTGQLDSHSRDELLALLRAVVDELGQTVLLVTHDPVVAAAGDEVVPMADGLVQTSQS